MLKKSAKIELIEALDKNDSKAVREACIKLQAEDTSVQGFLTKYNFGIDKDGKIYSKDDVPFNFKYLNQFIADYLGTNNYDRISKFNKELKDLRDEKKKYVENARAHGDFNN